MFSLQAGHSRCCWMGMYLLWSKQKFKGLEIEDLGSAKFYIVSAVKER
jgi:hypothetical protein